MVSRPQMNAHKSSSPEPHDMDISAEAYRLLSVDSQPKVSTEAAYCKDLDLRDGSQDIRITMTIDRLFEIAMERRASDIHLEPQPASLFVRFRIDGVLHTIHEFPRSAMPAL